MADNKWKQPDAPPAPLFVGKKERDLVKQVNDELIERVIGQAILYYPVSLEHSEFHDLYGEAIKKLSSLQYAFMLSWRKKRRIQRLQTTELTKLRTLRSTFISED